MFFNPSDFKIAVMNWPFMFSDKLNVILLTHVTFVTNQHQMIMKRDIIHKDFVIISTAAHESFSQEKYIYKYHRFHLEWLYKKSIHLTYPKLGNNWVIYLGIFRVISWTGNSMVTTP